MLDGHVIDVGANIGLATLFFHLERPGTPIVAVEPCPEPFTALQSNVERHEIAAVALEIAIGDDAGTVELGYYPLNTVMSGADANSNRDRAVLRRHLTNRGYPEPHIDALLDAACDMVKINRRVTTLGAVLDEQSVEKVGLLKIDVEGAEHRVLSGIADHQWAAIQQVVIEVHDIDGRVQQVRDLLQRHGLRATLDRDPALIGTDLMMIFATRRL
jgi:FkbM family methyltransferase